jgi:hypothetical protein
MIPLLIWVDTQLIPGDNVCFVATTSARGLVWATVSIYVLPMNIINNVYMRVTRYLHKAPLTVSTRAKRDVIVIRRIVLIVLTLFIIGTPTMITLLMLPFTKIVEPLFYRITVMTMALSMSTLSLTLVYTSPQLKHIIKQSLKKNQVAHLDVQNRNQRIAVITKANVSFKGVKTRIESIL